MNSLQIAVCGAHLKGLALNYQLTDLKANFIRSTHTAPRYKMYALTGQSVAKPGIFRNNSGASLEIEIWEIPLENVGAFLAQVKYPLCLGELETVTGNWVHGFLCNPFIAQEGTDITSFGGWRAYISQP